MFDWLSELDKVEKVGNLIIKFDEILSKITSWFSDTFGLIIAIVFILLLPRLIKLAIWLIHELLRFRP